MTDGKLNEEFESMLGDIVIEILETKLEEDPKSLRFNDSAD